VLYSEKRLFKNGASLSSMASDMMYSHLFTIFDPCPLQFWL